LDTSTSLVGFYVDHLGWQWLYWQGVVIAPMMGLMVYLGTPNEPVNRALLREADWGGLLLLGAVAIGAYAVYRTKREDGYIMGPRPSDNTGTAVHLEDVGAFADAEEEPLPEELLTRNLRFREIFGGKQ